MAGPEIGLDGYNSQADPIGLTKQAVSQKILENGLVLLVKPAPSRNLVAIDIKVRAGSSLEGEYLGSGVSHLVEHMLFKGTKTRPAGTIEREVKSYGAVINGSVSQDITDFYILLPPKYLKEALSLLKDMLQNASFDKAELEKEKEVILGEIRFHNDEPQNKINRILNETAYRYHPYKYPIIGYEGPFNSLARDDVIKYYNKMYVPNNMVIAIVGDVDSLDAIAKAEGEFKDFRSPNYSIISTPSAEPVQMDKRTRNDYAKINLAYIAMAFHSMSVTDKDLYAMDVLSMILGRGDNSRLNTALLKNKGIVHSISCWNYTPRDPGLLVVQAILDGNNIDNAEKAVMQEIKKIRYGQVAAEEFETAKATVLSDFIFSLQSASDQANDLASNYALTGSYDFSRKYVEGIDAVSRDDIKRVANKYLTVDNLTVVRLVPAQYEKNVSAGSAVPVADATIKKDTLPNRLRILVREDTKTPTVSITVAMMGGLMVENKLDNGITNLTSRLLLKGTRTRKENEIRGAIERRGGSINTFSGYNCFGLNIELLKRDLDADLEIVKDILVNSIFPQEEIDKEKSLVGSQIKEEDDDIFQKGFNDIRKQLFSPHPYSFRHTGEPNSLGSLTRENITRFYQTYCVPENMVISISGDVTPAAVAGRVKALFGDLRNSGLKLKINPPPKISGVKKSSLSMDKEESLVLIGFETTGVRDTDRYTLNVIGSILSGTSGRLFTKLRDKLSMGYTLGCAQKPMLDSGYLVLYVATAKDRVDEVNKSLISEVKLIDGEACSDEEILFAKRELATAHSINMQINSFIAFSSAIDEILGVGYDNIFKYEAGIEKVTKEDVTRVADKYLDLGAYADLTILST